MNDQDSEMWADVRGFVGLYQVSSKGRLRTVERSVLKSNGVTMLLRDKIHAGYVGNNGYVRVNPRRGGTTIPMNVHVLVLEAFVGPRPAGMQACHIDGDRANNRVENLRWGTQSENEEDKRRHGRLSVGELRWNAKLTTDDVKTIRSLCGSGLTQRAAADRFGVGPQTVWKLLNGRSWKHV